jgi:hypothetical protein
MAARQKKIEETFTHTAGYKMPEMDGFEFLIKYDLLSEISQETVFMLSHLPLTPAIKAENNKYARSSLVSKPLPIKQFATLIDMKFE